MIVSLSSFFHYYLHSLDTPTTPTPSIFIYGAKVREILATVGMYST